MRSKRRKQAEQERVEREAAARERAAEQAASPAVAAAPDRIDALTAAIGGELGRLRGEMRGRDADLVEALQQVAASYDRVAARLDDERRVQSLLAEALVRIDRRLAAMERPQLERPQLEDPQLEDRQLEGLAPEARQLVEGQVGEGQVAGSQREQRAGPGSREELPRPQRVIGGSIMPRHDVPRLDH